MGFLPLAVLYGKGVALGWVVVYKISSLGFVEKTIFCVICDGDVMDKVMVMMKVS